MPYTHSGEIGDVWKHLPLAEILKIEKPLRYHETNAACAQYILPGNSATAYGIYKLLGYQDAALQSSQYLTLQRANGIEQNRCYLGSPAIAMRTLGSTTSYFFHDIESESLQNITDNTKNNHLPYTISLFNQDSIHTVTQSAYQLGPDDFLHIDPYQPADKNPEGKNFYDVVKKAVSSNAKGLLWYGFDTLDGMREIHEQLKQIEKLYSVSIPVYAIAQQSITNHGCQVNPGVPGCGLAAFHLSQTSLSVLHNYLHIVKNCYANAQYNGCNASLLTYKYNSTWS